MTRNNTNFPGQPLRSRLSIVAITAPILYLILSALCFDNPNDKFTSFILMTGIAESMFWFMFNFFGDWRE